MLEDEGFKRDERVYRCRDVVKEASEGGVW